MNMGNLARMAQQMQADMARIEQELHDLQVEGSAGGGVVRAIVTGKQDIVSVTIDPSVVDPGRRRDAPGSHRGRRRRRPGQRAQDRRGQDVARDRRPADPRALSPAADPGAP